MSQERLRNQATFLTGDGIKYPRKVIYIFKNHTSCQKVKNMNHFVYKLLFWRQRWVAGARHGNSLVVSPVSPGRIIVCYFEQNMLFVVKLDPEYSSQLPVEAKATYALSLFLLAAKKKAVIVSFRDLVSSGHLSFDCRLTC